MIWWYSLGMRRDPNSHSNIISSNSECTCARLTLRIRISSIIMRVATHVFRWLLLCYYTHTQTSFVVVQNYDEYRIICTYGIRDTDLEVSDSSDTDLEVSDSSDTDLEVSDSSETDLEVSDSSDTDLEGSDSSDTDLEGSDSSDTDLEVSESRQPKCPS